MLPLLHLQSHTDFHLSTEQFEELHSAACSFQMSAIFKGRCAACSLTGKKNSNGKPSTADTRPMWGPAWAAATYFVGYSRAGPLNAQVHARLSALLVRGTIHALHNFTQVGNRSSGKLSWSARPAQLACNLVALRDAAGQHPNTVLEAAWTCCAAANFCSLAPEEIVGLPLEVLVSILKSRCLAVENETQVRLQTPSEHARCSPLTFPSAREV